MISKFKRNNINKIIYSNKSLDYSALKYCISFKEIISVIVGMASKLEIEKKMLELYIKILRAKKTGKKT